MWTPSHPEGAEEPNLAVLPRAIAYQRVRSHNWIRKPGPRLLTRLLMVFGAVAGLVGLAWKMAG